MTTGVILLNFGEPAEPDREAVVDYLTRIFLANASLEDASSAAEARKRSRSLAEQRAPGLVDEYEEIGGSPLNAQAAAQADALGTELERRGYDAATFVGMQFTDPTIGDAVDRARDAGVERLVGLPVYPLCGPSTTVQSLSDLEAAVADAGWDVDVGCVTGWHRHPGYNRIRAGNVRAFTAEHDVELTAPGTALVFSAHGTPQSYLEEGSRYDRYVAEYCGAQAALLGVDGFELGWQNHGNRDVPWTEPDVEAVIETVDADRVVVEPVSFMHEQSETLAELDGDLRTAAADAGLDFYRVPVPHDDDRFPGVLADLVEPFLAGIDPGYYNLAPCRCHDSPGAVCLNADGTQDRGAAGRPEPRPRE